MTLEVEIKQYIVTSFAPDVPLDQLPSDLDLLDNGVIDSLGLLRLIAWIGDEYDIPVDEMNISPIQFNSVDSIQGFIRETRSFV